MIHNDGAEPLNAIEPGFRNSHFDPVTVNLFITLANELI